MKEMFKILVIGAVHHNTLSIVRSLGKEFGYVKLIIVGQNSGYVGKSKYLSDVRCVNSVEELIKCLELNKEEYNNAIVISCSDNVSHILDLYYSTFKSWLNLFNCHKTPGMITQMMNKQLQTQIAEKFGLRVPISSIFKCNENTELQFSQYPCIAKPSSSFNGGKHIVICNNNQELRDALMSFQANTDVIIQQFIYKNYEIVIPGASHNGLIKMPGVVYKHRENNGATTYSTVKPHDKVTLELSNKISALIEDIGYEGLYGAEFIFDGHDYYFIELNLRNDATCYALDFANVKLAQWYVKSIMYGDVELNNVTNQLDSMVEFNDFSFVLRRKVGFYKWLKQMRKSSGKFYYDKNDIRPFWAAFQSWSKIWTLDKIKR